MRVRPRNQPRDPRGLCGAWLHTSEWLSIAARAGLPTADYHRSTRELRNAAQFVPRNAHPVTVIVAGSRTCGAAAPPAILEGCRRLSRLVGTELLGVEFMPTPTSEWTFVGATPMLTYAWVDRLLLNALLALFVAADNRCEASA